MCVCLYIYIYIYFFLGIPICTSVKLTSFYKLCSKKFWLIVWLTEIRRIEIFRKRSVWEVLKLWSWREGSEDLKKFI